MARRSADPTPTRVFDRPGRHGLKADRCATAPNTRPTLGTTLAATLAAQTTATLVASLFAASVATCFFWSAPSAVAQTTGSSAEQLRDRLEQLRAEIDTITAALDRQRAERDSELAELARIERELAARTAELRETRAARATALEREAALARKSQALETEIEQLRTRLAAQLAVAYRIGNESRLRAILNQKDPARISRALALHGRLARERLASIDRLKQVRVELERVRREQADNAVALERLAERQQQVTAQQAETLEQRRSALAQLEARIRDRDAELAELHRAAQELQSLLEQLAVALADIPPDTAVEAFTELHGRLPMPLDGRVLKTFSRRDEQGTLREGWLIEAELGAPVRAVAHGRVAFADWLRGYGMLLILDHGGGWMSLYGRNQALLAEVGDWVRPGEIIALAGDSGGNGPPGLYFQLRRDGQPQDPAGWLQR